jgi:molybdopterin-guanine dinucleotide biosynthesis protein A
MNAPVYGLVLAGGRSTRMQRDKAAIEYGGRPQLHVAHALLAEVTGQCFVSVRADQAADPVRAGLPQVIDGPLGEGPIAGIIAAQALHPGLAWLVVACDLPFLSAATLDDLLARRDATRLATAYTSSSDGLPEPLCAIYEPASRQPILDFIAGGRSCPRKFLLSHDAALLPLPDPRALENVNTPAELDRARSALARGGTY